VGTCATVRERACVRAHYRLRAAGMQKSNFDRGAAPSALALRALCVCARRLPRNAISTAKGGEGGRVEEKFRIFIHAPVIFHSCPKVEEKKREGEREWR